MCEEGFGSSASSPSFCPKTSDKRCLAMMLMRASGLFAKTALLMVNITKTEIVVNTSRTMLTAAISVMLTMSPTTALTRDALKMTLMRLNNGRLVQVDKDEEE